MQKIHNLLEGLLGLVLARNVGEGLAGLRLDIDLGVALAEHHRVRAAHPFLQRAGEQLTDHDKDQNWNADADKQVHQRGHRLLNLLAVGDVGLFQPVDQLRVTHVAGDVDRPVVVFVLEQVLNLLVLHLNLGNLSVFQVAHKGAVIHLHLLPPQNGGEKQEIEQHHDEQCNDVVINQRFSGIVVFYLIHGHSPSGTISFFSYFVS